MTGTSDPRGGEPVESDPAAATEKERTLHAEHCTPADSPRQMAPQPAETAVVTFGMVWASTAPVPTIAIIVRKATW